MKQKSKPFKIMNERDHLADSARKVFGYPVKVSYWGSTTNKSPNQYLIGISGIGILKFEKFKEFERFTKIKYFQSGLRGWIDLIVEVKEK